MEDNLSYDFQGIRFTVTALFILGWGVFSSASKRGVAVRFVEIKTLLICSIQIFSVKLDNHLKK